MSVRASAWIPVALKVRFITLGLALAFLPFSMRFCHLFLLLFMIACLFEGSFSQRSKVIAQNPLAWILPTFFILHLISVAWSDNVSNAWANVDKKMMFFLAPLIIVSGVPFAKDEIRKLLWIFLTACMIGSIACILNAAMISANDEPLWNFGPPAPFIALHPDASNKWPYFSYIGLASGIGIHPTYFALYLLGCVLIVLRTITTPWLMVSLVIYLVAFIVLLSSRVVVIATVLTLLLAIPKRKILIAAVLFMITVLVINPVALYRNAQEYTQSNFTMPPASFNDNPINIRTSLWWLSANAIGEINPIIGAGAGDVEDTVAALADLHNVHNSLGTSDPHNQYIHTFIALGAVGLLTLLAVFAIPLVILFQSKEFLGCAGLIAFMAVGMTESVLEVQKGIVLFSLFIALIGNQLREWRFSISKHLSPIELITQIKK